MRDLISGHLDAEVAGECADGSDAVEAIEHARPDLVFLDTQIAGMDGFAVVDAVGVGRMPVVVFLAADEQQAFRAFEVGALDYLLKPFDRERFERTLDRARSRIRSGCPGARDEQIRSFRSSFGRLVIRSGGRLFLLPSEDVDWIGAEGNYARIHAGNQVNSNWSFAGYASSVVAPVHFGLGTGSTLRRGSPNAP